MFQKPSQDRVTSSAATSSRQQVAAEPSELLQARLTELDAAHQTELQRLRQAAASASAGSTDTVTSCLTPGQKRFYASEQSITARNALQSLVDSPQYNTDSAYYSENDRDFVDRHLHFLSTHPNTNLAGYISNLKLMTGIKLRQ